MISQVESLINLKTSNKIEEADQFRYITSRFLVCVLDYTVPSGFDPNDSCRGQVHEYGLDFLELADRVPEQHDTEADKHPGEVWTRRSEGPEEGVPKQQVDYLQ